MGALPRRLEKVLVDDAALSRSRAREAIAMGRVSVDAEAQRVVTEPEWLVFPGDEVTLDGVPVEARREHRVALFHKPAGMVSTVRDPDGRGDLSGVVASLPAGCQPVGRLDRATTGALLFATDGDLAHALRKPGHGVPKVYELEVAGDVAPDDPRLALLRTGVETALGLLRAEAVTVLGGGGRTTRLEAVLVGGKNRQLRRMCYGAGLRLLHLHRSAFGPLELGGLAAGAWRIVTPEEVETLWSAVGGRLRIRRAQRAGLLRRAATARAAGSPLPRLERWLARGGDVPAGGLTDR